MTVRERTMCACMRGKKASPGSVNQVEGQLPSDTRLGKGSGQACLHYPHPGGTRPGSVISSVEVILSALTQDCRSPPEIFRLLCEESYLPAPESPLQRP